MKLLEVRGVSKSFPGVQALADMHLELRAGEVLGLVGENGAGKSTLMKLLSGAYTADEGEFFLNGEPYEPTSPKHALELGISIIHQEFNLMPDLTVAQNIFIGREPGRVFTSERRLNARARELIGRLHLPLQPDELVGNLTVARQQMVEIAKALSYDAKLLIMDEPTAALNDAEVAVLHELIRRFVRPDTGVIYISHRMDELRRIADRITVIRDGRYVGTRETARTTMPEVISMMVGRELAGEAKPVGIAAGREVLLEVSGLSTKDLLRDVSFELRAGEILGFAGLMGAGRTEVARAIVGADRIDAGTIRLRGRELRIRNPADAARHRIGYLSEDRKRFGLLLEQEVNANIGLTALAERFQAWGFVKDKAMRAASGEYVRALRIRTPSVSQTAKNLSGGNQQKVVIAKWLVKDCDILIFDEPTRGIDLSIGTGMTLCAVMSGVLIVNTGVPVVLGVIGAVLFGGVIGLVNGFNVSILGIPPFIATLAMMLVAQGLALVISHSTPIYFNDAPGYISISTGHLFGVNFPNAVLVLAVATVIAAVVLNKTILGRYTYSIGSNEEATALSGIPVRRWKIIIYTLAGLFTGLAGVMISARLASAQPGTGLGYELQAIAAVVIGGTSLSGGKGSIVGTIIGALIISVLNNGLQIMSIPQEWQNVILGAVILVAVYADMARKRTRIA